MQLNAYIVVERAIEEGVEYGYMRAHKYTDTPDVSEIKEEIIRAVMNQLSEVVNWDKMDDDGIL